MKIDVAEFAKPCPCGHVHEIVVEDIFIESGAIRRLPGLIARKAVSYTHLDVYKRQSIL